MRSVANGDVVDASEVGYCKLGMHKIENEDKNYIDAFAAPGGQSRSSSDGERSRSERVVLHRRTNDFELCRSRLRLVF